MTIIRNRPVEYGALFKVVVNYTKSARTSLLISCMLMLASQSLAQEACRLNWEPNQHLCSVVQDSTIAEDELKARSKIVACSSFFLTDYTEVVEINHNPNEGWRQVFLAEGNRLPLIAWNSKKILRITVQYADSAPTSCGHLEDVEMHYTVSDYLRHNFSEELDSSQPFHDPANLNIRQAMRGWIARNAEIESE